MILIHLLCIDKLYRRIIHKSHPLLKSTLAIWDLVYRHPQVSTWPSRLTPITNSLQHSSTEFKDWLVDGHLQFFHLLENRQLADLPLLRKAIPTAVLQDYQYINIGQSWLPGELKPRRPVEGVDTDWRSM